METVAVAVEDAVECLPRATTALPSRRACVEGSTEADEVEPAADDSAAVAVALLVLLGMRWRRSVSASICWKTSSLSTANSSDESCVTIR